ncbi:AAA family ATPase [Desulfoluna sp.]|uniref:AAA family ATPase n=1 Tax=Desulfoluna sp. TaxID=2045199 RepID=UPI00262AFB34|nr:AAA family ATPase [Desulfoluna sp.]
MKILHLAFQNLNSLAGRFEIDFGEGPLAEAGIFAITGPTGSGKTTILDAITLALFGKAARYDEKKRNNPENMMSRGTGECFSEVLFSCGQGVYSARWDLARARKKPDGKIQGTKRQLADASGTILETKIRQVDEKVTELTGMDYSRFLRSVLLAQGRFKEFLDAGVKDRGELLERITGTEIYSELSILAHEAAREKEEAVNKARLAADLIRLLSDEETQAFTDERGTLEAQKTDSDTELTALTKKMLCHAEWTQKNLQKKALQEEESKWIEKSTAFSPSLRQLERHNTAAPLTGDLKLWASNHEAVAHTETQLAQLLTRHGSARITTATALASAVAACTLQNHTIEARRGEGIKKRETLATEIAQLTAWQDTHAADEGIETALPQIRDAAQHYRSMNQGVTEAEKASTLTRQTMDRLEKEITQIDAQLAVAQKTLREKDEGVKAVTSERVTHKPKTEWLSRKEDTERMRSVLQNLTRHTETHLTLLSENDVLQESRAAQQTEIKQFEADIAQLISTLDSERRILTLKEQLHSQATLMASLEEKRSLLISGQECPLCGATDHPFASQELPKTSETKASWLTQQSAVAALEKKQQACEKGLASTTATFLGIETQIKTQAKKAAELSLAFSRITTEANLVATIGDRPHLETLTAENNARLTAVVEQIKAIETLEATLTLAEKECIAARGRVDSCAAQRLQLKGSLEKTTAQHTRQSAHQKTMEQKALTALAACTESTSPWNLASNTPESAVSAVNTLEKQAVAWRTAVKKLADARHTVTQIDAGLDTLALQITRITREHDEWTLKQKPFSDLPIDAPEVPETLLDEPARRALCDKAGQHLATVSTQKATTETELASTKKKCAAFHVELLERLSNIGFESIDALKAALLSEETHKQVLQEKDLLAAEKVRLETLLQQTTEALSKLAEEKPPTDEEAAALTARKVDIDTQRDLLLKRMGEINAALAADQKARLEQAQQITRIDALEAEALPWRVLKDLIGSSDGSKFSKFAQGLTLAQLVILANQRLFTLNPRYEIQRIPGEDLELEIIDRYQADAVRPTQSLSGGESFLVSLALALGLSEMAGQKTRIESLFIDEGFGSLDSETLDTALAALENLRLDNRAIGIISHVDLLKHRLGTQIEVTRKADGHSTLTVVDG